MILLILYNAANIPLRFSGVFCSCAGGTLFSLSTNFIEINDKEESKSQFLIPRKQSIKYHIQKYLKPYGNEIIQRLLPTRSTPSYMD